MTNGPTNITLDGFKKFAATKAGEKFNYENGKVCAFAQYLTSLGYGEPRVHQSHFVIGYDVYSLYDIHKGLPGAIYHAENEWDGIISLLNVLEKRNG
jgi:hypothetical protein